MRKNIPAGSTTSWVNRPVALSYANDDVRVALLVAHAGETPITPHSATAAVNPRVARPMFPSHPAVI
jgi:hypothetical protein